MMTAKRAIKKDTFFFLCLFALRGGFLPMMECRGGGKWGFGVAHGFEDDEVSFVYVWNRLIRWGERGCSVEQNPLHV